MWKKIYGPATVKVLTKGSAGNGRRVMKILWVKPGKLLPLDSGGKLRTYNILRHLSTSHELTYLSFYGGRERDAAYEQEIKEHLPGTVPVYTESHVALDQDQRFDYVRRFFSRAPYAVSKFTAPQTQKLLRQWIPQHRFDVAICDFLCTVLNFPDDLATPTALFQHNVETVLWKRKAKHEVEWLHRLVSKIEYAKMVRFEPEQVRRFHHVIAVSEQDREAMKGMVDPDRISVIPTGVDLSKYQYDPTLRPASPLVVFTGSMDWEANIDGVEYFCKNVWPQVISRIPAARFRIVGRAPHARVRALASDSVEVTGSVPSIVDHLREAAVIVVPLQIGGGTRIKIYEGMAMGKATVSTTIGAEGLDVHGGRDIVLADDPASFADAICNLLQDENVRRRFEAAAAETARKYDWSVIAQKFTGVLQKTIDAAVSVPSPTPREETARV
jgi:glycosyltransferase involved in cell wall biosynthesis